MVWKQESVRETVCQSIDGSRSILGGERVSLEHDGALFKLVLRSSKTTRTLT